MSQKPSRFYLFVFAGALVLESLPLLVVIALAYLLGVIWA